MKNLFKLATFAALLTGANAYAHHPAADIVDPEVYAMIEENISDVHLALDFDEMGSDSVDMGGAMASRSDVAGSMAADMGSDLESISLNLAETSSAMADVEAGAMVGRR